VRRDGSYMIRERAGAEVLDVQGWTEHDAVPSWEDREAGAGTVAYRLAVEVGPEDVVFRVNDTEVDRAPAAPSPWTATSGYGSTTGWSCTSAVCVFGRVRAAGSESPRPADRAGAGAP